MYGIEHVGMGLGGLGMLLIWAVPVILLIVLVRRVCDGGFGSPHSAALELLEARYARGEIDRETYLRQRADLENPGRGLQGG